MALKETILETPRFPEDISYGSSGGPMYKTDVITVNSGVETRNISWSEARHTYNVAFGIRDQTYLDTLVEFFHSTKGKAYGFRYKDWSDYKSVSASDDISALDIEIGIGDDVLTEFQVKKVYNNGVLSTDRIIYKIEPGSLLLSINNVATTIGWTVDNNTGIVTFDVAPVLDDSIKVGFNFDVPVRFDSDQLTVNLEMYQHGGVDVPLVELRL